MKTALQNFLSDLYEIDPTLQAYEADIIPLVEKFMQRDPAMEPDTEFVKRLRIQLKDRAADLSAPSSSGFQKWLFALGGAVTAAIILPIAFVAMKQMKPTIQPGSPGTVTLFSYSVTNGGKKAFGPLSTTVENAQRETGIQSRGAGGKANRPVMGSLPPVPPMMQPEQAMNARKTDVSSYSPLIPPSPMTKYEYVYEGALPKLSSMVKVYKRNPSTKILPVSALGSNFNLGIIDMNSLSDLNVDSVSFNQNKPYGYQLTVNLREASVSLDAQWDQWPQFQCATDSCFQNERVQLSDIPSEDQLIAAANTFIKDHRIDISYYGTPEVDMQWKRDYDRAPNKAEAWIPEQMRVLYPLMIDGQKVMDQAGMSYGVSVGIHTKTLRVMNVYGLMSREYVKSEYTGVSDGTQITDYLQKIDTYVGIPEAQKIGTKTAIVTLGEPVLGYSVFYNYKDTSKQELLVPTLTFPVKDVQGGDEYFFHQSIVIPLAAEMLKEPMNGGGGTPIPVDRIQAM